MRVLIIPEDFIKDQYMLKPIVSSLMEHLGRPRARVEVCQDPRLGGISEATKWENIEKILKKYPMVDLFLLLVDRDGNAGRRLTLDQLETQANTLINNRSRTFLAENAWQELEVWVLAGMDNLPKEWQWNDIRNEINPKEIFFLEYSSGRGLLESPGEGRKTLGAEAGRNYQRIRRLCVDDLQHLESKIVNWMNFNNNVQEGS